MCMSACQLVFMAILNLSNAGEKTITSIKPLYYRRQTNVFPDPFQFAFLLSIFLLVGS